MGADPCRSTNIGRSLPVYEQMENAMIALRMEPQQFAALCAGFDAADDPDAPIDPTLLANVRSAQLMLEPLLCLDCRSS
jgi:hypothetical protein